MWLLCSVLLSKHWCLQCSGHFPRHMLNQHSSNNMKQNSCGCDTCQEKMRISWVWVGDYMSVACFTGPLFLNLSFLCFFLPPEASHLTGEGKWSLGDETDCISWFNTHYCCLLSTLTYKSASQIECSSRVKGMKSVLANDSIHITTDGQP